MFIVSWYSVYHFYQARNDRCTSEIDKTPPSTQPDITPFRCRVMRAVFRPNGDGSVCISAESGDMSTPSTGSAMTAANLTQLSLQERCFDRSEEFLVGANIDGALISVNRDH